MATLVSLPHPERIRWCPFCRERVGVSRNPKHSPRHSTGWLCKKCERPTQKRRPNQNHRWRASLAREAAYANWSEAIRARDPICAICKIRPTSDAAHIIGRGRRPSLRLRLENGIGLCRQDHDYMTKHGTEWEEWLRANRPGLLETLDQGLRTDSRIQQCEFCGRAFKVWASREVARHCSMDCKRQHEKATAHETRTCKTCGKEFDHRTSQTTAYAGAGQFCSIDCLKAVPYRCVVCGAPGVGKNRRYCEEHAGKAWLAMTPLDRRAWSMASPLRIAGDKRGIVRDLLEKALGTPCPYCQTTLTLENASLDHKAPMSSFWPSTHGRIPLQVRRIADHPNNIQIICRGCNGNKGDFSDSEMRMLLDLPFWDKLKRRLSASKTFWAKQRAEGAQKVRFR